MITDITNPIAEHEHWFYQRRANLNMVGSTADRCAVFNTVKPRPLGRENVTNTNVSSVDNIRTTPTESTNDASDSLCSYGQVRSCL